MLLQKTAHFHSSNYRFYKCFWTVFTCWCIFEYYILHYNSKVQKLHLQSTVVFPSNIKRAKIASTRSVVLVMNAAGERSANTFLPEETSQPTRTHYNNTTERMIPPQTTDSNPLSFPLFISVLMAFDGWREILFIFPVSRGSSESSVQSERPAHANNVKGPRKSGKVLRSAFPTGYVNSTTIEWLQSCTSNWTEMLFLSRSGGGGPAHPADRYLWSQRDKTQASQTHHSNLYQTGNAL